MDPVLILPVAAAGLATALVIIRGLGGSKAPSRTSALVSLLGKPLNLPTEPIADPTPEQVDRYHELYMAEVQRMFETYKQYNPDYANKRLECR